MNATIPNPDDATLRALLEEARVVAVVGCSPNPERASHQIARLLIREGFIVYPVHPRADEILGRKVYRALSEIPDAVDIVDVFRKPEATPAIAREAAAIHARCLWLQQGIRNDEACHIATEAGMLCVQDLCIGVMLRLLFPQGRRKSDG